ncbi:MULTISPECIES: NaeI family type II restriction endonuclease [Corynebacterium]|uniref:Restriction endonuclease n=1 Tax=Corynebacterium stationis TaxID=1705 RepID=A0A177IMZ8_9CORY|nr:MULTISPECIES: NaeI family type II restriction endonuclease [Corynebacterium]MDN6136180.1 NaeI family type II restriction endonuclease [Corynebacterium sp.]MDN6737310.1 NaeI family type II restriction endonuclease [Corynebacterium sp.]OAH30249.1 restriction endonuclease [Corynebacterium stationis]
MSSEFDLKHGIDSISLQITEAFREVDPDGKRLGRVFRDAFDQAYDGQNTGRYSIDQLTKTEAAHIGSLVEILIRREFSDILVDGEAMDFAAAGYELDCKYSKRLFGWMIPMEALGNHVMLCHADDKLGTFHVGFAYIRDEILTVGGNRDRKRTISKVGRQAINWLFSNHPFPPNTLLQLEPELRALVLEQSSGAARLNMLFRVAQKQRIPRGIVATVAQQKDYMKRVRYNGGSRSKLQPEGIVILGDFKRHREYARILGLPIPAEGDSVSVRLYPSQPHETAPEIFADGAYWRVAEPHEPEIKAPYIPVKD